MKGQDTDPQSTETHRHGLHIPVKVIASLAALVDGAIESHPDTFQSYLDAAGESGRTAASQLLWSELTRTDPVVAEIWDRLRRGDIDEPAVARHALMLLLALDGWDRVKQCSHLGCRRAFADATNAASRRHCAMHARRRSTPASAEPPRGG